MSCLLTAVVRGAKRVPLPPARMMPLRVMRLDSPVQLHHAAFTRAMSYFGAEPHRKRASAAKLLLEVQSCCLHLGLVDEDPCFESLYWLELRHDIELASVADVSLKQAESSCSFTPC